MTKLTDSAGGTTSHYFTPSVFAHPKGPFKRGFHSKYNADNMTYQKW